MKILYLSLDEYIDQFFENNQKLEKPQKTVCGKYIMDYRLRMAFNQLYSDYRDSLCKIADIERKQRGERRDVF